MNAVDPLGFIASFYPSYRKRNYAQTVKRELKTGGMEKIIKNNEVFFRLTAVGKNNVVRDFPLLFLRNKKWDKKWRVVIYDVAEVSRTVRENLRRKLKELGFGMIQESVWVSPHDFLEDLYEYLETKKLTKMIYVFETTRLVGGEINELANKIWKLEELNEKYKKLLEKISHTTYDGRNIKCAYLQLLLIDPHLPKELLPKDWAAEKVRDLLKKL